MSGYDTILPKVDKPPPSVTKPNQPNAWVAPAPLPQRQTVETPFGLPPGVEMTPEMQQQWAVMNPDSGIDHSDWRENRAIADESKGLFLGTAMFDRVRVDNPAGWVSGSGIDPYKFVDSGLNLIKEDEQGNPLYGYGFEQNNQPAGASPAADLYALYQRGPGGEGSNRAYLQDLMFRAGLVDRDNPIPEGGPGDAFDQDYQDAWKVAVHESMRQGIPVMVLLRDRANYFRQNGGVPGLRKKNSSSSSGRGPTRPTAQIISEEDATSIVDEVAKQQLGRKLSATETELANGIVKAIRSKMLDETNAAIDQQMAGGGQSSRPTDPRVTAETEIGKRAEGESGAYAIAEAFANLIGLAGGA